MPGTPHRFPRTVVTRPPHPLVDEWVAWQKAKRLAPRTVARRARTLARFADDMGIDSPVTACRTDVIDWINNHPQWLAGTAAHHWEFLHSWFSWLVMMGHRPDNPMALLGAPPRPRGEPRPVSDVELVRLLETRMHHRTRVMIWLAALEGLRVSEIARVRGEDVDTGRRVIWVNGKGNKKATVPLHPILVATAPTMPRRGFWFPSLHDPNKPVLSNSVSYVISRAMRRAGISGTPHSLRHYFGSSLLANGADLRTVQACLRHASVATTQIYTRVPDDRRHEAVATLNPFGTVGG